MPIEAIWYDDSRTILWVSFPSYWNLTDYQQMVDSGAAMIEAQAHIVHVVYDFRKNFGIPGNLVNAARYAEKRLPVNQGLVIFLKPNLVIRAFTALGRRLDFKSARYLHVAESVDEVLQIISEEGHKCTLVNQTDNP